MDINKLALLGAKKLLWRINGRLREGLERFEHVGIE